ncbi:putative aspartic peptidase domain superfamily [Helianthus annuus]|nr:putative aspartic peptidase domain superfamily [Helianthus annuus]
MANKKSKKGATNKKIVSSKEETHNHNQNQQEVGSVSMDLAGSLDKMKTNVEDSVTQLGILVNRSLEKLDTLGTLRDELRGLKEDFKTAIDVIRLEMQVMIHEEIARLRSEVDAKIQNFHKNFAELEEKLIDTNKAQPEACPGSMQVSHLNTLNTQETPKTREKHNIKKLPNKGKKTSITTKLEKKSEEGLQLVSMVVNGRPVKALVDTGASHNFVSMDEAIRLGVRVTKQDAMIKTTNGPVQPILGMAYGVKVTIGKWKGKIDLSVLPMKDHNFVLGHDFFEKEQAFPIPWANKFCIIDGNQVHTMKTETDTRHQGMAISTIQMEVGSRRRSTTQQVITQNRNEDVANLGGGGCHAPQKFNSKFQHSGSFRNTKEASRVAQKSPEQPRQYWNVLAPLEGPGSAFKVLGTI